MAVPNGLGGWELGDSDVREVMTASGHIATPSGVTETIVNPWREQVEPVKPGDPEPAPGVIALLMHPAGHVEHVYWRDDQTARDAGYKDGERWWAVGDDVGPATWPEVIEDHDGPIFLVRVPVLVP